MRKAPQGYSAGVVDAIKKVFGVFAVKKKKRIISRILAAALSLVLFSGCGAKEKTEQDSGAEEFAGQRIGFVTGSLHEDVARQHYPKAEMYYYNNYADLAEALEQGKLDAYMCDEPVGRLLMQTYPDQCVSSVVEPASYAYAFAKGSSRSDHLREQLDAFIEECRQNGVMQELDDIWLGTDDARKTVDLDGLTGENGTVRFAVSTDASDPFVYFKGDKLVGYEVDLMARFCAKNGYDLEINNYSFASLLAAVSGGKADTAAATITVTEERKESMNFSLTTYEGGIAVMTKTVFTEDTPKEFAGKRLGIVTGTMFEDVAKEHYPEAELYFYNSCSDLAEALDKGKIDVYMLDEPVGRLLTNSYPDQSVSPVLEPASYAFAFAKGSERSDLLREQMDAFIEECGQNGVLQELDDIWLGTDDARKTVDLEGLTGENGTLQAAVSTDAGDPFIYFKEDKLVGYEIDLMARFCAQYGYDLEMTNYGFSSLLPAVSGGKADIAACTIAITEERKESVNFSLPTYEGGVVTVAKSGPEEELPAETVQKKIGVVIGTMYEDIARRLYPDEELCFYDNTADLAKALDKGEIDFYMVDEPVGRLMVKPYPDQHVSEIIEPASFAFAFPKDSEFSRILREQVNTFVEECRQNGVLQEIEDIWFGDDESKKTVSFDQLTGENGIIRLAISSDIGDPFVYFKNGGLVGYEPDLLVRFCKEYGYDLEITSYTFSSLFPALSEGLNDMASCAITVTPEREEIVDFSLPTYDSGVVIVSKDRMSGYTLKDFSGKKVGVLTGSIYDKTLLSQIPDAQPEYYDSYSDLAAAVAKGKIDAYIADEPVTRLLQSQYPDQVTAFRFEDASYAFMFPKAEKHQEICRQFNEFLAQSWEDGTIKEVDAIWFGEDEARQTVDLSDLTAENGVLEMAASSNIGPPFAFIRNGQMVGYDVDLAVRFCRAYGYGLHISDYVPSGILEAASSGKADMAASCITATPERQEASLLSEPDYYGGVVLVAKSKAKYTVKDFFEKKVGLLTGSMFEAPLKKYIPDAMPEYINANADLATALEAGKIDAYITDQPVARLMTARYPNQLVALDLENVSYAYMLPKDEEHQEICRQLNEFLAKCWKDGTIGEVDSVWFGDDEALQTVDLSGLTAENGVLEMAVSSGVGAPFTYVQNGQMVGYDVDLVARFCRAYGYGLHITDYDFSGVVSAIASSKADIAAGAIAITPERLETTLMSNANYLGGIVIVTRSGEAEEEQETFRTSLRESFERTFLRENRWKLFFSGLGITFMITMVSMLLGTLGGFAVYLVMRRGSKLFNGIWAFFASVMGRTPVVVILMILYYVIFGSSNLSNVWVSIIGFTLLFTCTVAELLKMGAGAVGKGQTEAALAMGYSEHQTYLRIILPQSIEHFLPAYKSEAITLVKATAIVGYIAVQDLTKVSDLVRSRTYEAFFPLIATAIIYYALTFVLTGLIRRINIIADPQRRSTERILRGLKTK